MKTTKCFLGNKVSDFPKGCRIRVDDWSCLLNGRTGTVDECRAEDKPYYSNHKNKVWVKLDNSSSPPVPFWPAYLVRIS